jgi:type II secretory pathway component PulJ
MKPGMFMTVVQGALALSAVLSAIFCVQFVFLTREARSLNGQVAMANAYRQTVQALAADCIEYSKKNPAIEPVLKSIGAK